MLRSLVLMMALGSLVACGPKKGGTLAVDTPALPYKAPDIEELSGVSDDEPEPPAEEPKAETAPTPAPTPAAAMPATPAKDAAAKAPAKDAATKAPAAAKAPAPTTPPAKK